MRTLMAIMSARNDGLLKMRKKTGDFIIGVLSVIVTLLILEILTRLLYPALRNYDTEMWRYAVSGKVSSRDGGYFHMNRPNAYFKDLYGVEVKMNSKGLRDYEYSYAKPPRTYRILVLGDSITFGWGVPLEKTYPKYLEQALNKNSPGIRYQVINTGIGNYSTHSEVDFLKREGLKYKPDMLILGYFINDAEIIAPSKNYFLNKYSYLYVYLWSKLNAAKARFLPRQDYLSYYHSLYESESSPAKTLKTSAEELKTIAGREKIPLLVILIPDLHNLKDYPFYYIHSYVKGLFGDSAVLDLLPYFDEDIEPSLYWVSAEDAHHNAKAHKIIADGAYPIVHNLIRRR